MKNNLKTTVKLSFLATASFLILIFGIDVANVSAYSNCQPNVKMPNCPNVNTKQGVYFCGDYATGNYINTSINFGCKGKGNAIWDLTFAIIRFISDGVGLIIVASMIVAGIQYTTSADNPEATGRAKKRIQSNIIALFLFIFAYAILNYLVPGQVLQ